MLGKVTAGKEGKPDTTFTMLDDDFIALTDGKLNPQNAFMTVSEHAKCYVYGVSFKH